MNTENQPIFDFTALNPFSISNLIIILVYSPLFLSILTRAKTILTRVYLLHTLSILIWGIFGFLISVCTTPTISYTLWKIACIFVTLIPALFYHTILILTNKQKPLILFFIYGQAAAFSYTILSNKLFTSTFLLFDSIYWGMSNNPIHLIWFIIWVVLMSAANIQLINYYKTCYPKQKSQAMALLFTSIGFVGGITNFLPTYNNSIYPWGNFTVPIAGIIVTYAILKYQLLDIKVVLKKSIAYSVSILLISMLYLFTVLTIENFLQNFLRYHSNIISAFVAFVIGAIFFPLHNHIHRFTDQIFFKAPPERLLLENTLLKREIAKVEQLRTVATLASGMAHEIKNPLTTIKTFTEHLPQKLDDKEFLLKFSNLVGHDVDRINELVHQLLEYAKPTPPEFKEVKFNKILEETIETLSSHFIRQKIQLYTEITSSNALILKLDPKQIRQALINALLNAIEAMPNGGNLTITTSILETNFVISIRDTGVGIPKQDIPHIFDPFFTKKDHGTGLGLSITRGIIEEHGGKIYAKSKEGEGTTIIFELPLSDARKD